MLVSYLLNIIVVFVEGNHWKHQKKGFLGCIVKLIYCLSRAGISNSFGFGGHNSVVAFSAFKP